MIKGISMKKFICLVSLSFFLFSCAPKPLIVNIEDSQDLTLNCEQLSSNISSVEHYKSDARKDDHFKLRYIFLPTGVIAAYRFNKAESNADKRIKHLQELANQKKCSFTMENKYINPQMDNNFDFTHYK